MRTLEDWEAGRRTPPEYIPRLIEHQMKYEKLVKEKLFGKTAKQWRNSNPRKKGNMRD